MKIMNIRTSGRSVGFASKCIVTNHNLLHCDHRCTISLLQVTSVVGSYTKSSSLGSCEDQRFIFLFGGPLGALEVFNHKRGVL